MKQTSTPAKRVRVPFKMCLVLCLSIFSLVIVKESSAHNVFYYNPPCFIQGQTSAITVQPWIANAAAGSYFHWQFRVAGGSWTFLGNGDNSINGRTFTVANAAFTGAITYSGTGAFLAPAFSITNIGTPAFTTQLDNVELRVLMTDGVDPQGAPGGTLIYGGEEFANPFEAKYIRLLSKANTDQCYSQCTNNRLVTSPANPTLDTYFGGFEMQPLTSANFFAINGTTQATAAQTSLTQWTTGTVAANQYRIMNNPDSMKTGFSGFAPHGGREMMVVNSVTSPNTRIWYRTITVGNTANYFQAGASFRAWFAKVDATTDPTIIIEVRGTDATNATTYTTIASVTQTVPGAAGTWQQISLPFTVPTHQYKKTEFSVRVVNAAAGTPISLAFDDICLLEPVEGTLPIVLTPLKGSYANGISHLNWSSLQESNTSHFEVERGNDGVNFSFLARVNAKGNSDRQTDYRFDDIKVNSGTNYYRLKLYDKDGNYQYTNIVALTVNITGTYITGIYPSPFVNRVNINVSSELKNSASIQLFDNAGKQVAVQQALINKGVNTITLDNLGNLARGLYFVKVLIGDAIVLTQKVIK